MVLKKDFKESFITGFQNFSASEKIEIISKLLSLLREDLGKKEITIPIKVFDNNVLSCFEAVVKYLREVLKLRYVKIAELLNRNNKTIWVIYQKTKKKMPMPFSSLASDVNVPVSVFSDRKFTIFESLVSYLKNSGLKNHEIALLLNRDDRTIWTVYDRVKKKSGK